MNHNIRASHGQPEHSLLPCNPGNDSCTASSCRLPDNYSRLIAEISARMVKVSPEDLDAEILRSIKAALQPLEVDRGGLLEVVEGSPIVRVSHAWFDDGIEHISGEINLADYYPWAYQKVVVEGRTIAISKFDDIPVEAEVDRRSQKLFAIKSRLTIPLFIGQRVHHVVSIDAIREERDWPDEVIAHLRLLSEIFVGALQRREAGQALSLAKDRLDLAASSAEASLWELDLGTGKIWATDIARNMFGFTADDNITLDNFLGKVHPEDRNLIVNAISALSADHRELSLEYRAPGPGEQLRWVYSRGRLTESGELHKNVLRGVTLDITHRKRLELKLQEQLLEIERLHDQLEKENIFLRNEVSGADKPHFISSAGNIMQIVMAQIKQVARTGSTVLVEGETGTGKEVVAQAIHRHSDRGKRVMIKVNCAALPAPLMESELFGREKGAYTGALSQQPGRFEIADKSTLFLDEIAELPHEAQAKLLRFLQEGEFERLGSSRTIKVDVRIIAATNRNLLKEVEQGRFRRDLYYRLAVFPIKVPPLRERIGDIEQLVWEFIAEFSERMGKRIRQIASRDMQTLKDYPWPGNVRELRNIIERAMIVSNGETLEIQSLIPASGHSAGIAITTLEDAERRHIQKALKIARGKVKGAGGAAELLDINPSTLTSRMLKLGIRPAQS